MVSTGISRAPQAEVLHGDVVNPDQNTPHAVDDRVPKVLIAKQPGDHLNVPIAMGVSQSHIPAPHGFVFGPYHGRTSLMAAAKPLASARR